MLPLWDTLRLVNISAGLSILQSLLQGRSHLVEVLIGLVSVLVWHEASRVVPDIFKGGYAFAEVIGNRDLCNPIVSV